MIEISEGISIGVEQVVFKFSRSGGPGGQNVNKVNTRVTVFFDVANFAGFSDIQKRQILRRLSGRADKDGVIRVVCRKYRAQSANRNAAFGRLAELLREALKSRPVRKKTEVPHHARQKRLEEKRHRSLLKKQRTAAVDY